MFDLGRDKMRIVVAAFKEYAFQREIVGFTTAAREYDLIRSASEQVRHLYTGGLDQCPLDGLP